MATAQPNPYDLLGLSSQGLAVTEVEIRKAYRKQAAIWHPDKAKNDKDREIAGPKFMQIKEAQDVLLDVKARAALDDVIRAQAAAEARRAGQSVKRQKMRADLDARERAAERDRSEEDRARQRLQDELQRLKRQAAEREAARQAQAMAAAVQAAAAAPSPTGTDEQLQRTLKVSWDAQGGKDYTASDVRAALEKVGPVEDVVVRTGKKRKGSALAVMASAQGALAALGSLAGTLASPLLVSPYQAKAMPPGTSHQQSAMPEGRAPDPVPSAMPGRFPPPTTCSPSAGLFPSAPRPYAMGPLGDPQVGLWPLSDPPSNTSASTNQEAVGGSGRPQAAAAGATSWQPGPLFPANAGGGGAGPQPSAGPGLPATSAGPRFTSFPGMPSGNQNRDFEDLTLMKMRQAQERRDLAARLQAEEGG